jgi:SAM-dependent methyltransferase
MTKNEPPIRAGAALPACPGCRAAAVSLVDTVATSELARLYRGIGVDVDSYLQDIPSIARLRCASCDLVFFAPACAGTGRFYEQLQRFDWYYQDEKPEYEHARRFVRDGASVLEVGCGKGAFRTFLPASVDYAGLEFNDEAVRKAVAAGLQVRKESIERHAAAQPGRYDVVCSFQVLEHVPDPATHASACVQALAEDGLLVIAVPAEDSFLSVAANAPLNLPPHHVLRWTDRALRSLALREGLRVVELWHEPVASFHRDWQLQTLAQYYFVLRGLTSLRLVDTRLRHRLFARLLRLPGLRDFLAARVGNADPRLLNGHTVMLVACKERIA